MPLFTSKLTPIFVYFFIYISIFLSSCAGENPPQPQRQTIESLGTIITITIYDNPKQEFFDESFRLVEEIHELMSLQVEGSDLDRLNRAAGQQPVNVDEKTMEVLLRAQEIARLSDSAFTPAIYPVVRLWDIGGMNPGIPDPQELEAAMKLTALEDLILMPSQDPESQPHRAYLRRTGMGVDLGGIAKGYAADVVSDYLKSAGVKQAILDFGGNILTIGRKEAQRPWLIGVQRPDQTRGSYLGTLPADDLSIVTSGVYERYFIEDGKRYHHLLDAATGYPADNGLEGVVIMSDVSMTADGYSTAVFVLGLEEGMQLVESTEDLEALFITADMKVYASSGIREMFTLVDEEYELTELRLD